MCISALTVEVPFYRKFVTRRDGLLSNAVSYPQEKRRKQFIENDCNFDNLPYLIADQDEYRMEQFLEFLGQLSSLRQLVFYMHSGVRIQRSVSHHDDDTAISSIEEAIPHFSELSTLTETVAKVSFVMSSNSVFEVKDGVYDIVNAGWDFVCQPVSPILVSTEHYEEPHIVDFGRTRRWIEGRRDGAPKLTREDALVEPDPGKPFGYFRATALWSS